MENPLEKSEKNSTPVVSIDGIKTRSIREAKKLTQLYVASVVGVTTDTISRWENNRYPTIRRDNAEKLAAALEVELAEILRVDTKEEEGPAPANETLPRPRARLRLLPLIALTGACLLLALFFLARQRTPTPAAARWLPPFGNPGDVVPVQLRVTRKEPDPRGFIIKERLPAGWRVVNASPAPAAGLESASELKWLVPAGTSSVTISYTVRVPADIPLRSEAIFAGTIVTHGDGASSTTTIGGSQTIIASQTHWADQNDDGRIDDNEIMPAYYLTEEMKGLGLDWRTIETIWSSKGYRWDRGRKAYVVVK